MKNSSFRFAVEGGIYLKSEPSLQTLPAGIIYDSFTKVILLKNNLIGLLNPPVWPVPDHIRIGGHGPARMLSEQEVSDFNRNCNIPEFLMGAQNPAPGVEGSHDEIISLLEGQVVNRGFGKWRFGIIVLRQHIFQLDDL